MNQMILQSEGYCKAIINLVQEIPLYMVKESGIKVNREEGLISFLKNFIAFLLLFPGHPEHGPFYLIKALLNAIQNYAPWNGDIASSGKVRVYMSVLSLFFTYYQRSFPYHLAGVTSNDTLYANDHAYMQQIAQIIDILMAEIMSTLLKIGERTDIISRKTQSTLALEFSTLLIDGLVMDANSASLVVKLIQLARNAGAAAVDEHYLQECIEHIHNKKGHWYQEIYQKISNMTAEINTSKVPNQKGPQSKALTSASLTTINKATTNTPLTAAKAATTTTAIQPVKQIATSVTTNPLTATTASPLTPTAPTNATNTSTSNTTAAPSVIGSASIANLPSLGRPLLGAGPGGQK